MSSVVKMLQGEIQLQKPPNPFHFYDSSPENSMIGGFLRALPKFSPTFSEVLYEEENQEREAITTNKDFGSDSTLKPPLLKSTPVERREVEEILKPFARKFPRGEDENTVIIYTTSDLGRTIYYECEQVRSILQLHHVKIDERMFAHHMYQLREALGKEQFPAVFVKGRFIGGAAELMKLEEEGKLEILLDGIQKLHN
ncbi:hypothetical protein IFM89_003769 [Coptis chinensis]|uniref:Glutaredoxin domain-containing protein n=1 Tax=Coptis chinensis TaxID=261450 RepID=A0A835M3L4_9MAGN|nr:hypothetical protein IFM89_003769 [Coptis chinensis]